MTEKEKFHKKLDNNLFIFLCTMFFVWLFLMYILWCTYSSNLKTL